MASTLNSQRASSEDLSLNPFEFVNLEQNFINENGVYDHGDYDVIFSVGGNSFYGHQKVFAASSEELRNCFDLVYDGSPYCSPFNDGGILRVDRPNNSSSTRITIDAPIQIFEAVFNYFYQSRITVPADLVPALYSLTKKLGIRVLETASAEFLIRNLKIESIGSLCHMVQFGCLSHLKKNKTVSSMDKCDASNLNLALALHNYLLSHSSEVVCCQTGQLSARLIVNLTGELDKYDTFAFKEPGNEIIALNFLNWAYKRLLNGERLSQTGNDENVHSDDEDDGSICPCSSNRSLITNKQGRGCFQFLAHLNATGERRSLLQSHESQKLKSDEEDAQLQNEVEEKLMNSSDSTTIECMNTQDMRITVDINDIFCVSEDSGLFENNFEKNGNDNLLTVCLSTGFPESETCLLAPTSLGVGCTTIWLAKLAGYLVSVSIKCCKQKQQNLSNENLITEMYQHQITNNNYNKLNCIHQSSDGDLNQSQLLMDELEENLELMDAEYDENKTITQNTAHRLNRNQMTSSSSVGSRSSTTDSISVTNSSSHTEFSHNLQARLCCAHTLDCLVPIRMLEARSGFGCDILSDISGHMSVVIAGGYTRKGCLNTVEIYSSRESSDCSPGSHILPPVQGPPLVNPRGRTTMVSSNVNSSNQSGPDVLYTCGGSTGFKDLKTVERITWSNLQTWLENPITQRNGSVLTQTNCNGGGTGGGGCYWQTVANLNQARSSLVGVNLSYLQQGALVSNTMGSVLVVGGVADCVPLTSVEAYIPERNQWVYLPNMLEDYEY